VTFPLQIRDTPPSHALARSLTLQPLLIRAKELGTHGVTAIFLFAEM